MARRNRKVVLDLRNGRLISRPLRQRLGQPTAAVVVEEARRVVLLLRVQDGAVDEAADAALRPIPSQCHVFRTNPNMACKPASRISADWPKAYGMYPTS